MSILKIVTASLSVLVPLFVARGYVSYRKRRVAECEGFGRLLAFAKGQITCYLRPLCDFIGEFSDHALEASGFLPRLRETGRLCESYRSVRPTLALSEEERALLDDCFSSFGRGYREEELDRLTHYAEAWEKATEREKSECARAAKLTRTLALSASVACLLLIL